MADPPLTGFVAALQHGPRPLTLFMDLLRSETAASPERRASALAGLQRYQTASRPAPQPPMPVVAVAERACLRDYGNGGGRPVVVIPSLINPPFVLDLAPHNSLLRWLAGQGHRPLLVDWGEPTPADREQDVTAHVERLLLPMLRALDEPPMLVGYCLGGTLALAAAAAAQAPAVALIAAPWHFAGFGAARAEIAALWEAAKPACETLGLVPMEVLQSGFWRLDPARTVAKFEALVDATEQELASFIALEDWANAGAPLTLAAGRQMFERFIAADDPGEGRWVVEGAAVDPAALTCPIVDFVSTRDRIVPAPTSVAIGDRRDISAGHVGMVVGGRARDVLWQPLSDWLSALPDTR